MAVIKAPNEDYAGVSAGVAFLKGVGRTDNPYLIGWFRSHGYEVEETKDSPEPKKSRRK